MHFRNTKKGSDVTVSDGLYNVKLSPPRDHWPVSHPLWPEHERGRGRSGLGVQQQAEKANKNRPGADYLTRRTLALHPDECAEAFDDLGLVCELYVRADNAVSACCLKRTSSCLPQRLHSLMPACILRLSCAAQQRGKCREPMPDRGCAGGTC